MEIKKNINAMETGKLAYYKLLDAYQPKYPDNLEEREKSIAALSKILIIEKVDINMMVEKIKDQSDDHDNYKSKISSLIFSRFWERISSKRIEAIKFNPEAE